jgi:hypothetical protein
MGEQPPLLVKEIHMAAEKLDINDLIAIVLDLGRMPHSIPSASASVILPSISCNITRLAQAEIATIKKAFTVDADLREIWNAFFCVALIFCSASLNQLA